MTMKEYEVLVETINPCGGSAHASKELREIETDDPAAYVSENSPYPILENRSNANGDIIISTGDQKGYFQNYTFME